MEPRSCFTTGSAAALNPTLPCASHTLRDHGHFGSTLLNPELRELISRYKTSSNCLEAPPFQVSRGCLGVQLLPNPPRRPIHCLSAILLIAYQPHSSLLISHPLLTNRPGTDTCSGMRAALTKQSHAALPQPSHTTITHTDEAQKKVGSALQTQEPGAG